MFPWVYEFHWSAGHVLFLGVFFSVAGVVLVSLMKASKETLSVIRAGRSDEVQWKAEFEDLPLEARVCRHQLTGEVRHRICHQELECRQCAVHHALLAASTTLPGLSPGHTEVGGFRLPLDRYYHRGHTWVQPEGLGTYAVGLDAFAQRLIGVPDRVELPRVGTRLHANGSGWIARKGNARIRILSPIDGVVTETAETPDGWQVRLRSGPSDETTGHLLRGTEVTPWIIREFERLQYAVSPDGVGVSLADGGELVPEMWKQAPDVDWDGVWGAMFLEA